MQDGFKVISQRLSEHGVERLFGGGQHIHARLVAAVDRIDMAEQEREQRGLIAFIVLRHTRPLAFLGKDEVERIQIPLGHRHAFDREVFLTNILEDVRQGRLDLTPARLHHSDVGLIDVSDFVVKQPVHQRRRVDGRIDVLFGRG